MSASHGGEILVCLTSDDTRFSVSVLMTTPENAESVLVTTKFAVYVLTLTDI